MATTIAEAPPPEPEWLAQRFDGWTTKVVIRKPSEWAEEKRYLPPVASALPGPYRFAVAPYLREIVDCLSIDSPVRHVSVMKGVQLGFTVGVLENAVGYFIEHVKTAPMMFLTADAELAKLRLETSLIPMIQVSDLEQWIKSSDEKNARKTGRTDRKLEWIGGGFLIPFGAINANKLRSIPIQVMLRDEIDTYPYVVGKDGDPLKLSADRTATFENSRKILDISTPLVKGQSRIEEQFLRGDQRRYFVRCLKCNFAQTLKWKRDKDPSNITGIVWETDPKTGTLIPGTVRYLCKECGHAHANHDKARLLAPEHGAEWIPTAVPVEANHRSYHISALYSPVGMQTWDELVVKFLDAWDVLRGRPKDNAKAQVFWNNVLGSTYEIKGDRVRFENVSPHRRIGAYKFGQVPNTFAQNHCGSPVLVLTCSVDVHKDNLAVGVFGWCRDRRCILVDYWRFEGDTEQLDDPGTWGRLRKLIEPGDRYVADDGRRYQIELTLIDSGYRADDVYRFCDEYNAAVFPVKGRDATTASVREFSTFETNNNQRGIAVTVDFYKDRWSSALRRGWDGHGLQPWGHFNAPQDVTDEQLKELTVETKREKIEEKTGKRVGHFWHRPSGAKNELWDVLIYSTLAFDLLAWEWSEAQGFESTNLIGFYDHLEHEKPFFRDPEK